MKFICTRYILLLALLPVAGCQSSAGGMGIQKADLAWNTMLVKALEGCDQIRIRSGGTCHREESEERTLFESTDPDEIRALTSALSIDEAESRGQCMCCGDPTLEIRKGGRLLASIGVHHGISIRWKEGNWGADGHLTEESGSKLVAWLAARGVNGPAEERTRDKDQQEQSKIDVARWEAGMPEAIRPIWKNGGPMISDRPNPEMRETLLRAIPDRKARILALFKWYGSGSAWNGFPDYESEPERLLLEYSGPDLVEALTNGDLSSAVKEGAARLFTAREFEEERAEERRRLPKALKQTLLRHCIESGDEEKSAWSRAAFAGK